MQDPKTVERVQSFIKRAAKAGMLGPPSQIVPKLEDLKTPEKWDALKGFFRCGKEVMESEIYLLMREFHQSYQDILSMPTGVRRRLIDKYVDEMEELNRIRRPRQETNLEHLAYLNPKSG